MRLLALVLCCFLGIPAPGQVPTRWDRLSEVPKTQEVKVHLRSGKVLNGTIQETTPDGLTFVEGQNVIRVDRDEIAKITAKSRAKGALIGGLAGFGVGGGICAVAAGAMLDKNNPTARDRLGGLLLCGSLVGGITGGIGLAVGSAKTLYAAERNASPAPAVASR